MVKKRARTWTKNPAIAALRPPQADASGGGAASKTAAVTAVRRPAWGLIDAFHGVVVEHEGRQAGAGGRPHRRSRKLPNRPPRLGFTVEMQTAPHDALLNRLATQPQSIDIADIEYFFQLYMLPRGTLHPYQLKKIKLWDQVVPIFTKGEYPDGRKSRRRACCLRGAIHREGGRQEVRDQSPLTGYRHPHRHNADTLGIRPDEVKRKIDSWAELLNPEWKGKTSIVSVPGIGIMDAAMAIEARGDIKQQRQRQHDQGGDRQDHRDPHRGRRRPGSLARSGHLRRVGESDGLGRD